MKHILQILGAIIYSPPPVTKPVPETKPVKVKIAALVAGLILSSGNKTAFGTC